MKGIIYLPKTLQQQADLNLLQAYGFDFERNIQDYLHEIAEEMRKALNETTKND